MIWIEKCIIAGLFLASTASAMPVLAAQATEPAEPVENPALLVHYRSVFSDSEQRYVDLLRQPDALPGMIEFINDAATLRETVIIQIGAADGPLYNPAEQQISLPVEFLVDIEDRFERGGWIENDSDAQTIILDVVFHTLLHEFAHAFIHQHQIPVVGREEDAADSLANVLLLERADDGAAAVLNAAEMFALEDEDIFEFDDDDMAGAHSLDIQRYYTALCHVYGSDPETQNWIVSEQWLAEVRADQCVEDYEVVRDSWFELLSYSE